MHIHVPSPAVPQMGTSRASVYLVRMPLSSRGLDEVSTNCNTEHVCLAREVSRVRVKPSLPHWDSGSAWVAREIRALPSP